MIQNRPAPEEEPMPLCFCGAEWASVLLTTELGSARVGKKCAGIVEVLGRLCGLDPKRRPALKTLK